jgi:hypothetical protein
MEARGTGYCIVSCRPVLCVSWVAGDLCVVYKFCYGLLATGMQNIRIKVGKALCCRAFHIFYFHSFFFFLFSPSFFFLYLVSFLFLCYFPAEQGRKFCILIPSSLKYLHLVWNRTLYTWHTSKKIPFADIQSTLSSFFFFLPAADQSAGLFYLYILCTASSPYRVIATRRASETWERARACAKTLRRLKAPRWTRLWDPLVVSSVFSACIFGFFGIVLVRSTDHDPFLSPKPAL